MPRSPEDSWSSKALRVRADVPHTFGTLLTPLALGLILWGLYLLERTIAHPLQEDASSILFGSVIMAAGLILLGYLLNSIHISVRSQRHATPALQVAALPSSRRKIDPASPEPAPHPFHSIYVDHVRISR